MRALSLSALAVVILGCSSGDSGSVAGDPDGSLDGVTLDEGILRDTTNADTTTSGDTTGTDVAPKDTATSDTAIGDTTTDDAGARCEKGKSCGDGALSCLCCAAGGPRENCTCSTKCTKDSDCTDATRPKCNQQAAGVEGFCTSTTFMCCWLCK